MDHGQLWHTSDNIFGDQTQIGFKWRHALGEDGGKPFCDDYLYHKSVREIFCVTSFMYVPLGRPLYTKGPHDYIIARVQS